MFVQWIALQHRDIVSLGSNEQACLLSTKNIRVSYTQGSAPIINPACLQVSLNHLDIVSEELALEEQLKKMLIICLQLFFNE